MLSEKIIYDNHLPIKVTTVTLVDYPMHYHEDIEVLYVLEGSIKTRNGCYQQVLSESDVYIFNSREVHEIKAVTEDNMVMILHIDEDYFSNYYPNLRKLFFALELGKNNLDGFSVLKTLMASIMMELLQKGPKYEEKVIESVHNLITCLVSNFKYELEQDVDNGEKTRNKGYCALAARIHRVMHYMYDNFERKLTLNEISDREGLSLYYLSHVIKEATGLSFQDLLNYIRVEASERLVLGTNKKMGVISEEVGFSAVRYFIKHFEMWYKMHPLEYRKNYGGKIVRHRTNAEYSLCSPAKIEAAIRKLRKEVFADFPSSFKMDPVIIDIDIKDPPQKNNMRPHNIINIADSEIISILNEPYDFFRSMEEALIALGSNYIVTTKCPPDTELNSLSILLYNVDENLSSRLLSAESKQEMLDAIIDYDADREFLFRFNGFRGKYRLVRYKMDRSSIIKKIQDTIIMSDANDIREKFINKITVEPSLYFDEYHISRNMSLRSTFTGIGSELIFIDKVE